MRSDDTSQWDRVMRAAVLDKLSLGLPVIWDQQMEPYRFKDGNVWVQSFKHDLWDDWFRICMCVCACLCNLVHIVKGDVHVRFVCMCTSECMLVAHIVQSMACPWNTPLPPCSDVTHAQRGEIANNRRGAEQTQRKLLRGFVRRS